MAQEVIEAFDQGHQKGFIHGYSSALQDIRSLLAGVTDTIPRDDTESIMARYHEIFKGMENAEPSEAMATVMEALA